MTEPDNVNHPPHYKQGSIECINAIHAALGDDGFIAFCKGNVIKYLWRAEHKGNRAEDLAKADWYMRRLLMVAERNARRPKPPSLKAQALEALNEAVYMAEDSPPEGITTDQSDIIRRALESLPD